MKRKKLTISTFLVSALGLIVMLKAFVYIIEHFVFETTGEDVLKVDESDLNTAFVVVVVLLLIRISYVVVKHRIVRARQTQHINTVVEAKVESFVCAECGKKVSEKVREYCLERPNKFAGQVYCYDHQKTVNL
ncbi:hypothetical protein LOZ80_34865 [Paenibacillus sp. HWE-109]|uniref:hypothetical protein n=1 Tax=Paenibacillus sp. HWE-109 TaxID=1306526 RepID=UPI001EDE0186|nr:hypothetical protein [Paenibacillus sp. HWE-109]UKS26640.1 hypothetical protein LOZ80_34865 [Paenibacillus sp. HWE-109]